jgi:hypothetical protein
MQHTPVTPRPPAAFPDRLLRETFEPELLTPSTVLLPGGPTQVCALPSPARLQPCPCVRWIATVACAVP